MLIGISEIKQNSIVRFHLYEVSGVAKFIETENKMAVVRG